ncbi:MAG: S46 family peptidase [Bacteroidales bacterium]|nr:S46 family peptidase [Bacteroidales bacterium]
MQKTILLLVAVIISLTLNAKEGMYLPMLLKKINASDMQAMGMRITAEEIYSVNQASLKDAIVHFGGGCTAELVSEKGLLLTNHHCGYRSIQKHSTIEHDYLTDGFWAKSLEEELPNDGLTATILQRMEDVTAQVLAGIKPEMDEKERQELMDKNIKKLTQTDDNSKFHLVEIKAFYYGNQYILMESIVFYDVRLVGSPPSNIGKFGGDTDNWMWPRHTGDFSVFRIYADKDNNPADYSKENTPYKPKKHLKISLQGYQPEDFTMVFGYPGTTQEYLPSAAIQTIVEVVNPFKIDLRRQKLDIMAEQMDKDPKIRIQYSAKYAGVANGWKKWIGENRGIKRLNTIQNKRIEEKEFALWARDHGYGDLIQELNTLYEQLRPYELAASYFFEAGYYQDIIRFAYSFQTVAKFSGKKEIDQEKFQLAVKSLKGSIKGFYKDFDIDVEKNLLNATISAYTKFPETTIPIPSTIAPLKSKNQEEIDEWIDKMFSKSIFADEAKLANFIENYSSGKFKTIQKDPVYQLALSYYQNYFDHIMNPLLNYQSQIDVLMRKYMQAQIEINAGQYLFPDANSTLRVSYGKVENYEPRDGVIYNYFTTLEGIIEKENPEIYDYVVEEKLKQLYISKDYGRYADADGSMHTCFIASNHTSGGNSGSPVLNAEGHLIGLNFDRNWEGTMSDLDYDPNQCRNITVDIRYCLFIIDKFAGAQHLIEEMDIID